MTVEEIERGLAGGLGRGDRAPFPPGYSASWALIIGINYADHPSIIPLQNAEADAAAVRDLLHEVYGFPRENITDLLGPQATREGIMTALSDTLTDGARVNANDRVLIFYAGHGVVRQGVPIAGRAEPEGYLIPADDNGSWGRRIPMQELRRAWENIPAKHVLCIVDACYSGLANPRRGDEMLRPFDNAMSQYYARQIITAGTSDQRISDVFRVDGGAPSQHSYLTHFLVEALRKGLPDGQLITAERLYEYLREQVLAASDNKQRPLFGSHGDERGVFLLHPPDVRLPRNIYDGLHDERGASYIQAAIAELRRLFNSVVKLEQPGATDLGAVERWREVIVPELLELLRSNESGPVLADAGALLRDVLLGSPALQQSCAAQLVAQLNDPIALRIQQAAAVLSALAGSDPAQSAIISAITPNVRETLEATLVQGNPALVESTLSAMVKFFPEAALPWLRLMLIDPEIGDNVHFLVFDSLPALGGNIDIRLIKQAIDRRPLNNTYRSRATESLVALMGRLKQKDMLNQDGQATASDVLAYTLRYDASTEVRRRALEAMVLSEDVKLTDLLSSALVDPSAEIRQQALSLLTSLPIDGPQMDVVLGNLEEKLINEPLAVVRIAACNALGQIWQKCMLLAPDSPLRQPRITLLSRLLGETLGDASPEVQRAAARALGVTDNLAIEAIRKYVQRGLIIRQAIAARLEDPANIQELEYLSSIVPPIFTELIDAFLQFIAGVDINDDTRWRAMVQDIRLMLEAAQTFGDPAFMPLLKDRLSNPPEHFTTDQGELNVPGGLYILALQALGHMPPHLASPLAQERLRYALEHQSAQLLAMPALAECLALLRGGEALAGLVDLLDTLQLPPAETEKARLAAADGLLRIISTATVDSEMSMRLHRAAADDPSEQVRQILGRVIRLLPTDD